VLPAAEEAESIWTEKFGFQKIKPEQVWVSLLVGTHEMHKLDVVVNLSFTCLKFDVLLFSLTNIEKAAARWWDLKGHLCYRKRFLPVELLINVQVLRVL
jgi:hypothetical protein